MLLGRIYAKLGTTNILGNRIPAAPVPIRVTKSLPTKELFVDLSRAFVVGRQTARHLLTRSQAERGLNAFRYINIPPSPSPSQVGTLIWLYHTCDLLDWWH